MCLSKHIIFRINKCLIQVFLYSCSNLAAAVGVEVASAVISQGLKNQHIVYTPLLESSTTSPAHPITQLYQTSQPQLAAQIHMEAQKLLATQQIPIGLNNQETLQQPTQPAQVLQESTCNLQLFGQQQRGPQQLTAAQISQGIQPQQQDFQPPSSAQLNQGIHQTLPVQLHQEAQNSVAQIYQGNIQQFATPVHQGTYFPSSLHQSLYQQSPPVSFSLFIPIHHTANLH